MYVVVFHDYHKVFLAIALRVRTLLTSATFRLYSGAERAAPIVTQVFLHKVKGHCMDKNRKVCTVGLQLEKMDFI